jgi:2-dehydropantoate 2-reductase
MNTNGPRLLVLGAGVNGSICAAALHDAGVDAKILARGTRADFIKREGVVIENPFKGTKTVSPVRVINVLDPNDTYDYILVVVRKNQVSGLLPVLAKNKSPNIVFMVNDLQGPADYIKALGRERVMLGFVFGAGKRDGDIVRAIRGGGLSSPFGEIDGSQTERLKRLVGILKQAGLRARAEGNITDWLATHAALVVPFAVLTIKHGCDTRALSRAPEDVKALVMAMRETLSVLRALGHRIVPGATKILNLLPCFLLVPLFRGFLASRIAEVGGAWHCSQAPDEMAELAGALRAMVMQSELPVPSLRRILGV